MSFFFFRRICANSSINLRERSRIYTHINFECFRLYSSYEPTRLHLIIQFSSDYINTFVGHENYIGNLWTDRVFERINVVVVVFVIIQRTYHHMNHIYFNLLFLVFSLSIYRLYIYIYVLIPSKTCKLISSYDPIKMSKRLTVVLQVFSSSSSSTSIELDVLNLRIRYWMSFVCNSLP